MIGRQISHFYIIRALGSGGMGVVYEAQDTRLPRSVAIKLLTEALSQDLDAIRRLKREARLASSLNHPNICTILDVDEGHGQAFIAMELLQGRTLRSRIAEGPVPLGQMLDIVEQVTDALAVAHDQGIIHRDITPGNVFLTDRGLVKLLDFGLARHFASLEEVGETDDLTAIGKVAGTVHYMAPERFDIDGTVDYRCDLFSLGVILYQMATGTRPFDIEPRSALIDAIRQQRHVPVRQLAPAHPVQLSAIVDRLLAKDPAGRYQSARELRADLAALRPASPAAPIPGGGPRVPLESVAILPFEILGAADATAVTFSDGLAEGIRQRLGAVPGLRVAPRTSTRAAAALLINQIGSTLGVDAVLEGTVQFNADRVRVTANLVATAGERSLLAPMTSDHRLGNLLDAQEEAAGELCGVLAESLSRSPDRQVRDPEAAHAFTRAMHHWRSCFAGGWRPALEHLRYALDRDPQYADARVALANAYNFLGFYCLLKPASAFAVARRESELALTIDPRLAAAHVELALAKLGGDWDWDGAEQAFRTALTIDGANPLAHVYYSWLLSLLGRHDAALAEAQKGHALASSSRLVACSRAQTLYLAGHHDEVIDVCSACLRRDPTYVFALHLRGVCHLARAERDAAIADLEAAATLSNRVPFYLGLLGRCYGGFGLREEAEALVAELQRQEKDTYVPPQCYVYIYAGLGEPQRALAYQEQAYADGASPFNYLTPSVRELYALDPYHRDRLAQMRLVL